MLTITRQGNYYNASPLTDEETELQKCKTAKGHPVSKGLSFNPVLCDNLGGGMGGEWEGGANGGDMCIPVADSCCMAETDTTL